MKTTYNSEVIQKFYSQVLSLHSGARQLEYDYQEELNQIPDSHRTSAANLIHYLALRKHDIRDLQRELGNIGLSSLGRSESHVIASLENVLNILQHLSDEPLTPDFEASSPFKFTTGTKILDCHADELLGLAPENRNVRIMVTLPSHAATDRKLVSELMEAGMDIARINCAHDSETTWTGMIQNIRSSENELGKKCLILMDLAGPKLRTGEMEAGAAFLHLKPERDERGLVQKPTTLKLIPESSGPVNENEVKISDAAFRKLKIGDELKFKDIPGRARKFKVFYKDHDYILTKSKKSVYLENGTEAKIYRKSKKVAHTLFTGIPSQPSVIRLNNGDILRVTSDKTLGSPAKLDSKGKITEPATVPCTIKEIFRQVKAEESILFDDGKIAGVIEDVQPELMTVQITRAGNNGSKLASDKGINFPDSNLNIPPVTEYDKECLTFALRHADMVGFSFVKQAEDIELLHSLISQQSNRNIGIVLKIETKAAFENLPTLFLVGLKRPPLGVMVARGDLGIEMGFERMAEVQEEILWLCEAAHVPVIWATQVLEQLNKKGLPSRSEVTDAAMSARAECVMLNKGTFMVETVKFLQDILMRMQDHQQKKTPTLRRLKVTENI